jgi:hypothetical protein
MGLSFPSLINPTRKKEKNFIRPSSRLPFRVIITLPAVDAAVSEGLLFKCKWMICIERERNRQGFIHFKRIEE